MIILHTRDIISTWTKHKYYHEKSQDKNGQKNHWRQRGSNSKPCTPLHGVKRLFCCSGWCSALVKMMSGRSTLRRSPFFMAGSQTQPLMGIAIQITPAPLLGLQHVATVSGYSTMTYYLEIKLHWISSSSYFRSEVRRLWGQVLGESVPVFTFKSQSGKSLN